MCTWVALPVCRLQLGAELTVSACQPQLSLKRVTIQVQPDPASLQLGLVDSGWEQLQRQIGLPGCGGVSREPSGEAGVDAGVQIGTAHQGAKIDRVGLAPPDRERAHARELLTISGQRHPAAIGANGAVIGEPVSVQRQVDQTGGDARVFPAVTVQR